MLSDAVYSILDTAGISDASPNYAPQDKDLPWVVYHVSSTTPTDSKDGVSRLDVVGLTVDIMHTTYRAANTTAADVRFALDNYSGTVEGEKIQQIWLVDQSDMYEEDPRIHRKIQNYNIRVEIETGTPLKALDGSDLKALDGTTLYRTY